MMSTGFSLVRGGQRLIAWLAGGVGILAAAVSALALPSRIRAITAAPPVVRATMVPNGVAGVSTTIPLEKVTSLALVPLLTTPLSAPWLALVQVPVKVMDPVSTTPIDTYEAHGKVSTSQVFVVAVRAGVSISLGFLAPMLLNSPEVIILFGCSRAALMLITRPLRSHLEVLIGVITGMLLVPDAMFDAARSYPTMVLSIVIVALTVAACLLAANVINVRTRPWLTRVANVLSITVLPTTLSLTTMVWGMI